MSKITCFISGQIVNESDAIKGQFMRNTIFEHIKKSYPNFTPDDYICQKEYNRIRREYLIHLISVDNEKITNVESTVINAITGNKILSENLEPEIDNASTIGQRAADKIASFWGSWKFIISFFALLLLWILMNVWFLGSKNFDPYPFILLNLILSCLAAIQAPIIMMSQNRKEQKDRVRSENDYKVNLKAELEIKLLHEKIDYLTFIHNKHILEIQQLQIDYLDEIMVSLKVKNETEVPE